MPNNPKCFIHQTVIDVTFRTEYGLPLVAAEYMRVILEGILARAQTLYPITICHFVVMANHMHMILVVQDPEVVKDFIGTIKKESAHAVNRLLGRRKRTVWCDGYDSAIILDPDKVVERIVHIYINPQKANLVESIEHYPNLNTWQDFVNGGKEEKLQRIPRACIPKLPRAALTLQEQSYFTVNLLNKSEFGGILCIEPDAWLDCFAETRDVDPELYKQEIVLKVREHEQQLTTQRSFPVIGAEALRLQPINRPHVPKKFGPRMICLSTFREVRVAFISWYKERCEEAAEAIAKWMLGDLAAKPPPGFFLPGGVLFANVNLAAVF